MNRHRIKLSGHCWKMTFLLIVCLVFFLIFITAEDDNYLFDSNLKTQQKQEKELREEIDSLNDQLFLAINTCLESGNCLTPVDRQKKYLPKIKTSPQRPPKQSEELPSKQNKTSPQLDKSDSALIIAFDNSINMTLHPNIGPVMENKLIKGLQKKNAKTLADIKHLQSTTTESRLTRLKPILKAQLQKTLQSGSLGLISFSACDNIQSNWLSGENAKQQASQLIDTKKIQGLAPLSKALSSAIAILKKQISNKKSIALLITHGDDHCGVNFCNTANRLKQQNPGLVINVVNLGRTSSFSCITEKRLGNVYQPITKDAWEQAINEAANNDSIPEKIK